MCDGSKGSVSVSDVENSCSEVRLGDPNSAMSH